MVFVFNFNKNTTTTDMGNIFEGKNDNKYQSILKIIVIIIVREYSPVALRPLPRL